MSYPLQLQMCNFFFKLEGNIEKLWTSWTQTKEKLSTLLPISEASSAALKIRILSEQAVWHQKSSFLNQKILLCNYVESQVPEVALLSSLIGKPGFVHQGTLVIILDQMKIPTFRVSEHFGTDMNTFFVHLCS